MSVMSNVARSRGLIAALMLFVATLAALMLSTNANATPSSGPVSVPASAPASVPESAPASASQVPYPPTAPSSSSVPSSAGVSGVVNNRPPADTNTNQPGPTANTGFQT